MKLVNATPHSLNVFNADQVNFIPAIRKYIIKEGQKPSLVIPPSGFMLNVKFDSNITVTKTEYDEMTIDTREKKVLSCDSLPHPTDHFVVSALYAAAVAKCGGDTSRLRIVSDPVYESEANPKPIGCLGISPAL